MRPQTTQELCEADLALERLLGLPVDERADELAALHESLPELADLVRRRLDSLGELGLLGSPTDDLPARLGRFELGERLGEGGMGVVHRARDLALGRDVALKVLRPEIVSVDAQRKRLRREASAAGRLSHPHIVPLFAVEEDRGFVYLVLQLVEGRSLDADLHERQERISAGGPRPDPRATVEQLLPIVDALAHAHRRGVVHRDVKPGNILIGDDDGRAHLVDFGVARLDDASVHTATGSLVGSVPYMSPEQARGRTVDHRTDLFSFGCVLYQAISLEPPFGGGDSMTVLRRIVQHEPTPLHRRFPDVVPRTLAAVIERCMSKEVDKRYQSAEELAADLRAFLDGEPVRARPLGPTARLVRAARREPILATAVVALIVVATAFASSVGYLAARWPELTAGVRQVRREAAIAQCQRGWIEKFVHQDDDAARSHFVDALTLDPGCTEARIVLGFLDSPDDQCPVRLLAASDEQNLTQDTPVEELYRWAVAHVFRGPFESSDGARRAVECARTVLLLEGANPLTAATLARAALKAGDAHAAEEAALVLSRQLPRSAYTAYWAGYALLQTEPERAASFLEDAVARQPDFAAAWTELGTARWLAGRHGDAIAAVERALELDDSRAEPWLNLAQFASASGDFDRAVTAGRRATDAAPDLPGAHFALGQALLDVDAVAAAAAFDKTIELEPRYAEAWLALGFLRAQAGRLDDAVDSYDRTLDLDPACIDALRGLANVHARRDSLDRLLDTYARIVALAPTNHSDHDYYCTLLTHKGDLERLAREKERFDAAMQNMTQHASGRPR